MFSWNDNQHVLHSASLDLQSSFMSSKVPIALQPSPPIRAEIQALRAIAVIAVLFFHAWPRIFARGFLGVDIFFVISGYLMCVILMRRPVNAIAIRDFYYRRARRILPLYVSVVLAVLLVCIRIVDVFEYRRIINIIALPSLFFYSNMPAIHAVGYFDLSTNLNPLLHTWSLSAEVQFYLVVPLLFAFIQWLDRIGVSHTWTLICGIIGVSFYRQTFAYASASIDDVEGATTSNAAHMAPDARVWQFAVGFVVWFGQRELDQLASLRLSGDSCASASWSRFVGRLRHRLFKSSVACLASITLIVVLLIAPDSGRLLAVPIARLLVVTLTAALLALNADTAGSTLPPALATWPLQQLGDYSYGIYLCHWPLYILHRTLVARFPTSYSNVGQVMSIEIGVILIFASIVVGFSAETTVRKLVSRLVGGWRSLLLVLLCMYTAASGVLVFMDRHSIALYNAYEFTDEWGAAFHNRIVGLYERRSNLSLTRLEAATLNRELTAYGVSFLDHAQHTDLPSDIEISKDPVVFVRRAEGKGSRNIVVLGNSHAACSFDGLRRSFSDVYVNATLYACGACVLGPPSQQFGRWAPICRRYVAEMVPALRAFRERIDIIIVMFGFANAQDDQVSSAESYADQLEWLQQFHDQLANIATERVIFTDISINFHTEQIREVLPKLHDSAPIGHIGTTRASQFNNLIRTRSLLHRTGCSKCALIDPLDAWCEGDGQCSSIDKKTNVLYFYDSHHVTLYGSLSLGDYLRSRYDALNRADVVS